MKKYRIAILGFFLLLFLSSIASVFCEESNSIYIKVYDDGSALWILEKRFELVSQEDIDFFKEYTKVLEEDKEFIIQEKKESLQNIINSVAYSSGREMKIENVSLNYQIIDSINKKYGIVEMKFLWKNFSILEKDTLRIGDAFVNGNYIKEGEVLVIEYPENYSITSVIPVPNEKRARSLFWYGPKIFLENEPKAVLKKNSITNLSNILIFGVAGIIIILLAIILLKRKQRNKSPILISDQDKIIQIIKSTGGKCFQNDIVSQSGLSKSKISQIITQLEKKNLIIKEKYGKNNLIILK